MSISQIQADGGVNPLKEQQIQQVEQARVKKAETQTQEKQVGRDSVEISAEAKKYQEVDALKKDVKDMANPSQSRLNSIQSSIQSGTYVTEEALEETSELLAARLF